MALAAQTVTKRFGGVHAVNGVSFSLERTGIVGLLGPNGAGKTTLMRMLAGVLAPDDGVISVDGADVVEERAVAQALMGYLPEGAPLDADMTPMAHVQFLAAARGLRGAQARGAVLAAAERAGLGAVLDRPIAGLSKGYRRRTALAGALVHDPAVLILDEPTDGLDPNQRDALCETLKEIGATRCVLLSTHRLDDIETLCTRVLVMHRGGLVADATPEALRAAHGGSLAGAFRVLTSATERAA